MKISGPLLSGSYVLAAAMFSAGGVSQVAAKDKPVIYSIVHGTLSDSFWAVYRKGLHDAASGGRSKSAILLAF
jgi:ABC-type sugar transport system substrate-binding protein